LKRNEIIRAQITDLAYGGRGIAKINGKVVFVEGGLPGELLDIRITRIKREYCEAIVKEVIEQSPNRIKPACQHFGVCGGCKWQNYDYNMQLAYKAEQLKQQLIHLAGIAEPPVESVIGAKKIFYYRNKMEFSFGRTVEQHLVLGLHHAGYFDRIFDLQKCHLESEISNEIVLFVKAECLRLGLPIYDMIEHNGLMRFLIVREGKFTNEIMVNIVTGKEYSNYQDQMIELCKGLAEKFDQIKSLFWTINAQKANIARWDEYPEGFYNGLVYGRDHIYEKLGSYKFRISPNSFFQTNSFQAQILYDMVIDFADLNGMDKVLDLYCGTGTIAIYLSALAKSIIGVETVEGAVGDAIINAKENGVTNIDFVCGNVEEMALNFGKIDKVILDPPRAGLHAKALKGLIAMKPPVIVYVSCNPSTLARDIAGFIENGYQLQRAVALDMFPHTYHIEAVTKLIYTQ
jgi:23S rRNA (uracil1939-C5)-methyltransferase